MIFSYSFLPKAYKDVKQIREWYDEQSHLAGDNFLDELEWHIVKITKQPDRYLEIVPNIRRCIMRRFPYKIFYTIDANVVVILRVRHHKQKPLKRFR